MWLFIATFTVTSVQLLEQLLQSAPPSSHGGAERGVTVQHLASSSPHPLNADNLTAHLSALPAGRRQSPSTKPQALPDGNEASAHTEIEEHTAPQPRIAIIIDDIGYRWRSGQRATRLAGDVTLAVLPFSPYAHKLALLAEQQGKELMLHAPMEPESHHSWRHGLNTKMNEQTIRRELTLMLNSLPMVKGVNNHMGSALTQREEAMTWVMDELFERNLYFIDSRTSAKSRAFEQAQRRSITSAKRDVFLDNVRTPEAIKKQFDTLVTLARVHGRAIAIGHPYPETLLFLEAALRDLPETGVQLLPVSQLLRQSIPSLPPQFIGIVTQ